jgi:hypothetical protein
MILHGDLSNGSTVARRKMYGGAALMNSVHAGAARQRPYRA